MDKLNCAQLTEKVTSLFELINEQSSVIEGLKTRLNDTEFNMATMKTDYTRKIEDLELKLSISSKASSTATLDAVTAFYSKVDQKAITC